MGVPPGVFPPGESGGGGAVGGTPPARGGVPRGCPPPGRVRGGTPGGTTREAKGMERQYAIAAVVAILAVGFALPCVGCEMQTTNSFF